MKDEWPKRCETKEGEKKENESEDFRWWEERERERESKEKEVLQGVGEGVSFGRARERESEISQTGLRFHPSAKTHPNFHPRSTPGRLDAQRWPPSWLGGHRVPPR